MDPVLTTRRPPEQRVMPGDRARHIDGREGLCIAILEESGERVIDWNAGGREALLPGFLERLPCAPLLPRRRIG
jgi:hypothetical protein